MLEIVDLKTVYYQPTISETDFDDLTVGQPVKVNVDAYPNTTFHGKISAVYPAASTTNRQFSIRVSIDNPGEQLRPGMYARGAITTQTKHDVIIIPYTAMVPQQLGTGFAANTSSNGFAGGSLTLPPQQVFLISKDNTALAQPITLGIVNPNRVEVTGGLSVGQQLIVEGLGQLNDGDKVKAAAPGGGGSGGGGSGGGRRRHKQQQ